MPLRRHRQVRRRVKAWLVGLCLSGMFAASPAQSDTTLPGRETQVVLKGIGEIHSPSPATIVIFEPSGEPTQPVNLLLLQVEDTDSGLAMSLRIPFARDGLSSRHEIPGGVTTPAGQRHRVELALSMHGTSQVATNAIILLEMVGDRVHGRIERAILAPFGKPDGKRQEFSGHFEAPMEITCWSRVRMTQGSPNQGQISVETALFRLDNRRSSAFCAGLPAAAVEIKPSPQEPPGG